MQFLRKHYGNIIFIVLITLLIIPQTRMPILVFFQRLLSSSPREIKDTERKAVGDYTWQLRSMENKQVDFSESSGKVTVVNFWATWCPPCIAEMPSLQKLYDKYGSRVNFYFVSDEEPETLKIFFSKKGYSLPVYTEQSPTPAILQSSALPTTFVISKTGKIVIQKTGAAKWNSWKVHHLLDKLLTE